MSLYEISIPVFIRILENLSKMIEKTVSFINEKNIPPEKLLTARLAEDMPPFIKQIQMASDTAKFLAVRVAQVPNVVMEDNETTFPELQDRISATIAFLKKVPPHAMDSREDAETIIPMRSRTIASKGKDYTLNFAIPNSFFHITVAYSLLRHNGVPIGKMDFLGTL